MPLRLRIEGQPRSDDVVHSVFRKADAVSHDFVKFHEMLVGIGVVTETPRGGVERNGTAQPIRVVHEVAEHAASMRIDGIAVGHTGIAGATGSDETAPIAAGGDVTLRDVDVLAFVTSRRVVFSLDDLTAILEVVFVLDLTQIPLVVDVTDVEEHVLPVGIFGDGEHGVGRLPLVLPLEAAAEGHDADRMRQALVQGPVGHIELVGALVVHVAVSGFPEPVPVVMDVVGVVLIDDRGPAPEVPVQVGGRRRGNLEADATARLAAVAVGDLHLAELAGPDEIVQAGVPGIAASLRAVLNDHAIFLLGLDGHPALHDVMTHRFFHVDVFAGLGAPDGHERVPMIRRGNGNGIEVLILERFAHVRHPFAGKLALGLSSDVIQFPRQDLLVGIDEVGDFHVVLVEPAIDVTAAAAVDAGHRDAQAIVGAQNPGCGAGATDGECGAGGQ